MAHGYDRHHHAHTPTPPAQPQMTFAEIGTLYNSINNEVEGGVTPQNQVSLFSQAITAQTQLQNLIDSGALNNLDGAGNPINKRNAWQTRGVLYVHLIPPGADDTVHFRLSIPRDAVGPIRLAPL